MDVYYLYSNDQLVGAVAGEDAWDKIARFIMTADTDIMVTDAYDRVILTTMMTFLDKVTNATVREKILDALQPYQLGEKDTEPLEFIDYNGVPVEKNSVAYMPPVTFGC